MNNLLIYEEWYDLNEKEIWIELSEIGADRELDFNPESEFETRYENPQRVMYQQQKLKFQLKTY